MNSEKEYIKSNLNDLLNEEIRIISYLINCMVTKKGLYKKWLEEKDKNSKAIKYIEETTQRNNELGCTKLLTVRQVEMLLKILEEVSE